MLTSWVFSNAYYVSRRFCQQRPFMEILPKLALIIGLLLIVVPATLRIGEVFYVDNSTFTAFFAIGLIMIVIANSNRRRPSDEVRRTD